MFFRKITTRKNGKEYVYVKLIENYRINGKMKQRVVANFGSMENLSASRINDLITSLKRLYQEVEAQGEKKLDLSAIKAKIPGVKELLLHNQTVQSICKVLNVEEQKVFMAILIKMLVAEEVKEPIQGLCSRLGLVDASSIQFYNLIKKIGESNTIDLLLKSSLGIRNQDGVGKTIYIHIMKSIFQGATFDADITGNVYVPQNYRKPFDLLLACDEDSNPLDFSLVENKSELLEKVNAMLNRLANSTQCDLIVLDSGKELVPKNVAFPVAQPTNQRQENIRTESNYYFDSIRFEQKSEGAVKEIKANLAKVAAGLENIKADILLGKLNKESVIRKKAEVVINGNGCRDLVTYHLNESDQSLVYHIREEALQEKNYSRMITSWCVTRNKVKNELLKSINIKTDRFHVLTDQLNIPPINMYGDYHYSSDIISGHLVLEIIVKQIAVVAKIPQQGGEAL